MKSLVDDLYKYFTEHYYEWKIDSVYRTPTKDELARLLTAMYTDVRDSVGSISVESGRLLVKRTDGHVDVYVHVGEIKENND